MRGTGLTSPGDFPILVDPGQVVQIGDAKTTSHVLNANDDFFVTGKFEADGIAYFDSFVRFYANPQFYFTMPSLGCSFELGREEEEITIPVGQGAAGVNSAGNLVPENSTIIGVSCRVTQAPGGGATTLDVGRTGGGNLDEFIDGIATALGTTGTLAANHDAATIGPVLNAAADTVTLTTDANVTGSDMKVRVVVFYRKEIPPTS